MSNNELSGIRGRTEALRRDEEGVVYRVIVDDDDHEMVSTILVSSVSWALDGDGPVTETAILRYEVRKRMQAFAAWRATQKAIL